MRWVVAISRQCRVLLRLRFEICILVHIAFIFEVDVLSALETALGLLLWVELLARLLKDLLSVVEV